MTHITLDQDGSTGSISGFRGGRGGASGGTVSHAARNADVANSRMNELVDFLIDLSSSVRRALAMI